MNFTHKNPADGQVVSASDECAPKEVPAPVLEPAFLRVWPSANRRAKILARDLGILGPDFNSDRREKQGA